MHGRYEGLREAADQTYQWILDPDPKLDTVTQDKRQDAASFLKWFRCGSGIFWVSGKPGSGKSTLMKYLAEHIALKDSEVYQPDLIVLSFFFWIKGDDLQRSHLGCMRSLLWQLLQNPSTMNLATQTCGLHFRLAWTESVLRTILSTILKDLEHSVAIFIDGLDESNDCDEVLSSLSIFEFATRVKICVSSRPEPIFVDALRLCHTLKLEDLNSADIQQVIKQNFLENNRVLDLAAKLTTERAETDLEDLGHTIEHKSDGVFLWVHLVIKDLLRGITQRDDLSTLSQRLHRLPNDIYTLYQDMLRRTHQDYELYKDKTAFYLALALHRDYSLIEFCFAVNENLRKKYLCSSILNMEADADTGADIDCETVMAEVRTYTAGLLDICEFSNYPLNGSGGLPLGHNYPPLPFSYKFTASKFATVRLMHRTAIDFLRNTAEGMSLMASSSSIDADIRQICFESTLVCGAVLPGILGQCMSSSMARDLCCRECSDEDVYNALKGQGQRVLDTLHSAGLLLPDKSIWMMPKRRYTDSFLPYRIAPPFPSSEHACADLAPILIKAGKYRAAETWLDDYECMNDKPYLTAILMTLLSTFPWDPGSSELKEAEAFLKRLIENGADVHHNLKTQIGEAFRPIDIVLWELRKSIMSTDVSLRVFQLLGPFEADIVMAPSPSCFDCHEIWHHCPYEPRFELWGAYLLDVGKKGEVASEDPRIPRSYDSRISVIASMRVRSDPKSYPVLWAILEEDSQLLMTEFKEQWWFMDSVNNPAPGILQTAPDRYITKEGTDRPCPITIDTICARSPVLTFAQAMERLGKSRETIRKFYEGEAERIARENSWRREGWKQWYWGTDIPPGVDTDLE